MTMAGVVIVSAAVVVDAITAEAVKRPIVLTSAAETAATQRQFAPAVARHTLAAALSIREARDRRQGMSQRRTALRMKQHLMPQRLMPRQHMVVVGRHTAVVENTSSFRLLKQAAQGKSKRRSGTASLLCVFLRRRTLAGCAGSDAPTAVRYD